MKPEDRYRIVTNGLCYKIQKWERMLFWYGWRDAHSWHTPEGKTSYIWDVPIYRTPETATYAMNQLVANEHGWKPCTEEEK